jgi:DNA-binding FadR family transcriptional regulator
MLDTSRIRWNRFGERILAELNDEPIGSDELCRRTGISREAFRDALRFARAHGLVRESFRPVPGTSVIQSLYSKMGAA